MTEHQLLVNALWAIHTYVIDHLYQTPYLLVTSPEPECGKSRLLEVHEQLVNRPWPVISPSQAVLFRKIDAERPTLLWDEIDTVFNPKSASYHEDHRAVLDQGHRRHGRVPRFINNVTTEFRVFGAKALAGIGTVPDTIARRSIPIRLQRRSGAERVEDFILRDIEPEAKKLRVRLAKWAKQHGRAIGEARPAMPDELSDRMKEGCEALVAIADELGAGQEAREALVGLLSVERLDETESMRIRLLRDIRSVFEDADRRNGGSPRRAIRTMDLIGSLVQIEEAPWLNYYGRTIEPRDLASLLRPYGLKPKAVKFKGETHKGYRRDELQRVWERYLKGADDAEVTE